MRLTIPKDYFSNPTAPSVFLCTQSGTKIGELNVYNTSLNAKWNAYSTFNFETNRTYVDMITGETKVHPLFDRIEGPRTVLVDGGYGYFVIQDEDTTYSDGDSKSISAFSLEYNLSSRFLNSFHVNTGEIDSFEVMYELDKYGSGYDPQNLYELASGSFDPYRRYYIQVFSEDPNVSPTYEGIPIANEDEYNEHFGDGSEAHEPLYVKTYENVKFYDEVTQELSLLHIILKNMPDWKVGHIDDELKNKERKISEERIDIYSLFTTKLADVFECVFEFDTIAKTISAYKEEEDGLTDDGVAASRYDTDVYISRENLASEVQISTSTDNIKTRLKVGGSEDLDIREVNLGKNYIMNLDYYHGHKTDEDGNKIPDYEWMEQDLFEQYSRYEEAVTQYSPLYTESMQNWVKAYNSWDTLMNDIPVVDGVLRVGDEFKKLYCTYTPIDDAYIDVTLFDANINSHFDTLWIDKERTTIIEKNTLEDGQAFTVQGYYFKYIKDTNDYQCVRNITTGTALQSLYKKLNLYHVDEDVKANKTDNILLRLQNTEKDTATIRVYCQYVEVDGNDKFDESLQYYVLKENRTDEYIRTYFSDETSYNEHMEVVNHAAIFTNQYYVKTDITRSSLSASEASQLATLSDWIQGKLTVDNNGGANLNNLEGFKITQIGTLGAYFCLAKQEIQQNLEADVETYEPTPYLKSFGVRLLQEKQNIYMTIFQTQTEGMFSQEKYQCIVSDDPPAGNFAPGTRWIDSNSSPVKLHIYNNGWGEGEDGVGITEEDRASYENYQRYIDNFNKLKAVQEVLADKEREAQYWLDGYVSDRRINLDEYKVDSPAQSLEGDMHRVAAEHFGVDEKLIARVSLDANLPLYTFTTSFNSDGEFYYSKPSNYKKGDKWIVGGDYTPNGIDLKYIRATHYIDGEIYYDFHGNVVDPQPKKQSDIDSNEYYVVIHRLLEAKNDNKTYSDADWGEITTYAVYLKGQTPYVSFSNSRGVYQAWMDYYSDKTELESFFNEDQWSRLNPLIRDDEFTDDNFLLNGLESEEERLDVCRELMEAATKELKTLSQPSLEFSMSMANIFALPEFEPLYQSENPQFALGNFIRIELREGLVKKARLLEVNLNFDDLSDFSCVFGNLISGKSEIDLHAELLSQAINAGKQVATSSGEWQKSVEKSNKLEESINNGLADAALQVGRASGQAISWDEHGLFCRKYQDGSTDSYTDDQIAIINNKLVFTKDGWKTSEAALGEFEVDVNGDGIKEKMYGLLAKAVVSGYISGSKIEGGSLTIGGAGGKFIVHENGSVQILGPDNNAVYASPEDIYQYHTELEYTGSTVFSQPNSSCIITAKVYSGNTDITDKVVAQAGSVFEWFGGHSEGGSWTPTLVDNKKNVIKITNSDVGRDAQIMCKVTFDDENIKGGGN